MLPANRGINIYTTTGAAGVDILNNLWDSSVRPLFGVLDLKTFELRGVESRVERVARSLPVLAPFLKGKNNNNCHPYRLLKF